MEFINEFQEVIGIRFNKPLLLLEAMTHRSYLNENRKWPVPHNERLEFLGDAVLELAVTTFLFQKFPNKTEGELTQYRSALVRGESLFLLAKQIGINSYLLLSKGEEKDIGRARQNILAGAIEAIIGAIYVDQGYREVEQFVARHLYPKLEKVLTEGSWQDAKSRVQEAAQGRGYVTPVYTILSESGPDHDRQFTTGLFIGEKKVAEGTGKSKKDAEQAAARKALEKLGWK